MPWQIVGGMLFALGVVGYFWCAALFVQAQGTPAPIAPTKRAVVSGPYRINRNPMYTSVLAVVLGQATLYRSSALLCYAIALFAGFHLFVIFYEEPTLQRQFGGEYKQFLAHVPRWIPQLPRRTDH